MLVVLSTSCVHRLLLLKFLSQIKVRRIQNLPWGVELDKGEILRVDEVAEVSGRESDHGIWGRLPVRG